MEVDRKDVLSFSSQTTEQIAPPDRKRLLQEAMRPALTLDQWQHLLPFSQECLDHFLRFDCQTHQQEALIISFFLRQVLEHPTKTAALITPDTLLTQYVKENLLRWNIKIDDSAGTPLDQTPLGNFFILLAKVVTDDFTPVSFLCFAKHP